jgi:uncharacterized protein (TIGR03435 family)
MTRNRLVLLASTAALFLEGAGWAGDRPRFDAVSLRLQPGAFALSIEEYRATGTHIARGSVDFNRVFMLSMIRRAYGVEEYQIRHVAWMENRYSGRATFPEKTPLDQVPAMMRAMLEERFGLRAHIETKVVKVWLLEQAPGGAKLAKASGKALAVPGLPFGVEIGRAERMWNSNPNKDWLVMSQSTMRTFCILLSKEAKRPVLDRTGLEGEYDVNVEVANAYPRHIPPPSMTPLPPMDPIPDPPLVLGPALKQLGLKFRESREPVEFLIIDAVPSIGPKS